jgi:hypothetical protein
MVLFIKEKLKNSYFLANVSILKYEEKSLIGFEKNHGSILRVFKHLGLCLRKLSNIIVLATSKGMEEKEEENKAYG